MAAGAQQPQVPRVDAASKRLGFTCFNNVSRKAGMS